MFLEQIYFQYCAYCYNSFNVLMRRGQRSLTGFQFGTFIGRFQSDGAASVAVNGLKLSHGFAANIQTVHFPVHHFIPFTLLI